MMGSNLVSQRDQMMDQNLELVTENWKDPRMDIVTVLELDFLWV